MSEPYRDTIQGTMKSEPGVRLRLHANYNFASDGYEFFFGMRQVMGDGVRRMLTVTSFAVRETDPMEISRPAFVLTEDEAQMLMDELWRTGLRPKDAERDSPDVQATLWNHLNDMRTIAFAKLEIELPK